MDYDLSTRLSPREFEHLVQALAEPLFRSLVVFGDGPDGGREATFEGKAPYPTEKRGWNGYVVFQAKFRQRSEGGPPDGEWFLDQLERELRPYVVGKRRVPDYLVLATNVVLTPPAGGAKDQVKRRMEEVRRRLNLRGWEVWDYDKLRVLLDNNADVRRSKAAWISPGDVLHEVLASMDAAPGFERTLASFLGRELLADQYVNLEQAGHALDDQLPLSRVFTDLPVSLDGPPEDDELDDESPRAALPDRCVELLLDVAARTLRPRSPEELVRLGSAATQLDQQGRVVVVGGPGQGKSTLGQFLCQLHRAALLAAREPRTISPEARRVLDAIEACAAREGFALPRARRFPLHVTLSEYATALADDHRPSDLLGYLVEQINRRTRARLSETLFHRWLGEYPWLIVLDGLDEVPASSNRDDVLASVADFWVDASLAVSDVLVVATTRPQGYNGDFSPRDYLHLRLDPLSPEQALRYGHRLAEQRYRKEKQRLKVQQRLDRAVTVDATRRLMESPLQVTIMAALVDRMGNPPQERWSLFSAYYRVIYEREMERDIPASEILREHRVDVDAIHQRAALLLQVKSEQAQQTDARLTRAQLSDVITRRLVEEEHESPELELLRKQILDAAALRLVFLVGLQQDRVGFEIRSLQEYMAAECLVDAPDEELIERLTAIAPASGWRNVMLFAAGNLCAGRQYRRRMLTQICHELNTTSDVPLARESRAGSELAVDLLLDGLVRKQPGYERAFADEAARMFRGIPRPNQGDLLAARTANVDAVFARELRELLRDSDVLGALAGWRSVLELERLGVVWAAELAAEHWPDDPADVELLLTGFDGSELAVASRRRLIAAAAAFPLPVLRRRADQLRRLLRGEARLPVWWRHLDAASAPPEKSLQRVELRVRTQRAALSVYVAPAAARVEGPASLGALDRSWLPVVLARAFGRDPTAERLARTLRRIASACEPEGWQATLTRTVPWPLATCLAHARDVDELRALAERAQAGGLGDTDAWLAAERRWAEAGVEEADLRLAAALPDAPFDAGIGDAGFPLWFEASRHDGTAYLASLTELLRDTFRSSSAPGAQMVLARRLLELAPSWQEVRSGRAWTAPLAEIASWLEHVPAGWRPRVAGNWIVAIAGPEGLTASADALDRIGRHGGVDGALDEYMEVLAEELVTSVNWHPERSGLWNVAAHVLGALGEVSSPTRAARVAAKLDVGAWPEDPLARAAAAAIRLHTSVDIADADAIVDAIVAAAPAHADALALMLPLFAPSITGSGYEQAVVALEERVPREALSLRGVVAAIAITLLRRRTSSLADPARWAELGLFERDEQVLAAPA